MSKLIPADSLAARWLDAWNAHDLERILALYHDDFEMSSPYIVQLTGEASGTLRGKAAVGDYWRKALDRFPQLHFEAEQVLYAPGSVVLIYRSNRSGLAAEVFFLDDQGLIRKAAAHYAG